MATFTYPFGRLEVEGSINTFISNNIFIDIPQWAGQIQLNFNFPNEKLLFPAISVTHFGATERIVQRHQGDRADGAYKSIPMKGRFEIDCWVDATVSQDYQYQLLTMMDMALKLFRNNIGIHIQNVYTNPIALTDRNAAIRNFEISIVQPPNDPNPAIRRMRAVIMYIYEERF